MRKSQLLKILEQIGGDPEIILELERVSAIYISEDFDSSPVANDEFDVCTNPNHKHNQNDRGFCLG